MPTTPASDVDCAHDETVPEDALPSSPDDPRIEVRRSRRRTRTVSARREGDGVVVLMPAGLTRAEERRLVSDMLVRLGRSGRRRGRRAPDDELMRRATALSDRWLGGRPRPASVRWVGTMSTRWASCSPGSREIRVSESLREVPSYVLDYVLIHELAHLVVPDGHPPEFWDAVRSYPRTERAMGYLEAYSRTIRTGGGDADVEEGEGVNDLAPLTDVEDADR